MFKFLNTDRYKQRDRQADRQIARKTDTEQYENKLYAVCSRRGVQHQRIRVARGTDPYSVTEPRFGERGKGGEVRGGGYGESLGLMLAPTYCFSWMSSFTPSAYLTCFHPSHFILTTIQRSITTITHHSLRKRPSVKIRR